MSQRAYVQKHAAKFRELKPNELLEFNQLVAEIQHFGFTESRELSQYIIKNKLGHKYKNISGILEMQKGNDTWNFKGGFPPNIYAMLCEELNFKGQGSEARPVGFTAFKDTPFKDT